MNAWGRAYEAWGVQPKLSRANAEDWFGYKDGYKRGSTPRVGAIICWRKGKAGYSKDGAGHVAFVERVNADGSILISQSGYYSKTRMWTQTLTKKSGWHCGTGLTFQGFIYPPVDLVPATPKSGFKITNYTYPGTLKKGHAFTIQGTINSQLGMTRVEIGIVNAKTGKYVYHYDNKKVSGAKTFAIVKADSAMMFRKLPAGSYYYRIWAWDKNGAHKIMNKSFAVK